MDKQINHELRLGSLLVERRIISNSQLAKALHYQKMNGCKVGKALITLEYVTQSQINKMLKRQKVLKILAGTIALTCSTFGTALAETPSSRYASSIASQYLNISHSNQLKEKQFSVLDSNELSKTFYFSGSKDHLFSINADFSNKVGIQFSFLNSEPPLFDEPYIYDFEPKISLFSSVSTPSKLGFTTKKIGPGLDRASNTTPITFMLTLRGRCLYENSGNKTTIWSLDSAKKGVQHNAELMFSITKHF